MMKAKQLSKTTILLLVALFSIAMPIPMHFSTIELIINAPHIITYASSGAPNITVTPKAFAGASSFTTILSYAMYGAWLVVFGMIIVAAIEAARGNHMGDTFKRILVGVIIAAFLLTFGWGIVSGVF
ncbi:hypothetical protein [Acidianus sp. HS-5]|uniref:hypothetical protein n=1 Tax=Acidianus sp. HS-5 TaxID=2886040 RepID=UPI001F37AE3D|nr:hypothetical protein [Acidianus sp. HS-5]BDC18252.1 hypothetical protein HS5_11420 [Acidianus sp. HS-5]